MCFHKQFPSGVFYPFRGVVIHTPPNWMSWTWKRGEQYVQQQLLVSVHLSIFEFSYFLSSHNLLMMTFAPPVRNTASVVSMATTTMCCVSHQSIFWAAMVTVAACNGSNGKGRAAYMDCSNACFTVMPTLPPLAMLLPPTLLFSNDSVFYPWLLFISFFSEHLFNAS